MDDDEYAQDCKNKVKKADNHVIITILHTELVRRKCHSRAPQLSLPFRKAMKEITKLNIKIDNEYKARAVPQIGDDLVQVIKSGLQSCGLYRREMSQIEDTRAVHRAMQQHHSEQSARRRKRRRSISKAYVPRAGSATRAMLIVLGLAKDAEEGDLMKETIIRRARHHTNVDMNAKHDYFGVYDGFKGMTTLIEKECVVKKKKLYHITKTGYKIFNEHCRPNHSNNNRNQHEDEQKVRDEQRYQSYQAQSNNQIPTLHQDDNDMALQQALSRSIAVLSPSAPRPSNNHNEDDQLKRALLLSKEEDELQRVLKESLKHNSPSSNSNSSASKSASPPSTANNNQSLLHICPFCVAPKKTFKTKWRYDRHMKLHNVDSDDSDCEIVIKKETAQKPRSPKRRISQLADLDDKKDGLDPPNFKKRKIVKAAFDELDKIQVPNGLQSRDNFLYFDGKQYEMVLFIDTMEQNIKNLSSNYFDVLEWVRGKGVSCRYKKLLHGDYVIVLDPVDSIGSGLMLDFVVERKRYDDLRTSVCEDGRGEYQKEDLKKTPLTRKCYLVEGNKRMIKKEEDQITCQAFLDETKFEGYCVKFSQSKHESMNLICGYYQKLLHEFKMQRGHRHVVTNYSFADFQKGVSNQASPSNGVYQKELEQLKEMGFLDANKNAVAIKEAKGNVKMAMDIVLSMNL